MRYPVTSTDLTRYLDWPGLGHVFRVEHTWRECGRTGRHLHFGLINLVSESGTPQRLLTFRRGHVDVLGEDASLIHVGQGLIIMGLLRKAALSLLYRAGVRWIQARLHEHGQPPEVAVSLVVAALPDSRSSPASPTCRC